MASEFVVVADVNVYVHAAIELDRAGWPPDWTVEALTLEQASLNAVAVLAERPPVLGECSVSVYSSTALDDLVLRKLTQPDDPGLLEHDRGLGLGGDRAERIFAEMAGGIDATGRSCLVDPSPGEAPLPGADYEDRCVWGLFRAAMDDRPADTPLLVTNDRPLALQVNAEAVRAGERRAPWAAVSAARFCAVLVRYR